MKEVSRCVEGFRLQGRRAAANLSSANERERSAEAHSAFSFPSLCCAEMAMALTPSSGPHASHLSYIANDWSRPLHFH